jgi:ribosomal protein S18 acetylase RimI-like enzyme
VAEGIPIRPARLDEVDQILALWREAEAIPSATDDRDAVRRLLQTPHAVVLVAETEGRLAGTVIGAWDGWRGNIYRLAVAPGFRRRGLARSLVAEADRSLSRLGARRITALVDGDHPWAVDFWNALAASGYRHDEHMRRYFKSL